MTLYTTRALAERAGITYRQANYWTTKGWLVPAVVEGAKQGTGSSQIYDETAVLKARIMGVLLDNDKVEAVAQGLATADKATLFEGCTVQLGLPDVPVTIEDLRPGLTVRSYNVLKREGVNTVDQMVDAYDQGELEGFRNLGEKSYNEIVWHIERIREA